MPENINKRERQRKKNKQKILDLILNIILETGREPTIDEIAVKSPVSRRTVFNYFQDKEELFRELNQVMVERILGLGLQTEFDPDLSFESRLDLELDNRAKVYEYITPMRRIVEAKKHMNSTLYRKVSRRNIELDRIRMHRLFASYFEHDTESVIYMFMTSMSWNNWNYLRSDLSLSITRSRELLRRQIMAVYRSAHSP